MKKLLALLLSLSAISLLHAIPAGLSSVPFTTSQAKFAAGDSITITEVLASSANLALGDTFVVRGTYTLQSQAAANLGISLSTTEPVGVPDQATARRQVTAGASTFEMEYTVQFAGSIYLAFTPATGGASFGRIYLSGTQSPGTPTTPTTPTTPDGPGTTASPINTAGLGPVPFATTQAKFEAGDSITITDVLASSPAMQPGDIVLVRGSYVLQSRAQALLMISLTVNAPGAIEPTSPTSRQTVNAGSGTFEVAYEIKQPGALHVTFYPATGGSSFGGVYFGAPGAVTGSAGSSVTISNPAANTGKFANLSIRSLVGSGESALVAGVTVTDQERYVLIRGVGPSLSVFGISNFLRKPTLTVYDAAGEKVAAAASWSAAFAGNQRTGIAMLMNSVGAFPLAAGSDDAVLNLRLVPGSYTVMVSPGDDQAGVALLEIYASSTFTLPLAP